VTNLRDLARELCEEFEPQGLHIGDPCPGCYLTRRLTELGVTTEWGIQVPFAGDPERVMPIPTGEADARTGAPLLSSEAIPATVVTRSVTTWAPA
jgi:hypothetical protein